MILKSFLPFLRVPEGRTYVFIVGCYDSGTTLLDHILGCHEEISNLPTEGVVLTSQLSRPEDFGWPRLWYKCADCVRLDEMDTELDVKRLKKEWGFWFDKKKPLFLEKSIANSARIRWLNKNFDQPYFISIIRNGYCVAEGIRRRSRQAKVKAFKFRESGYPIKWCADQWVVNNDVIEEETRDIERVMKITYEDLTDNLEETIRVILQWLPLKNKDVPRVGNFTFRGESGAVRNMNEQSIARLSLQDVKEINEVAGAHLKKWGYPLLGEDRNSK